MRKRIILSFLIVLIAIFLAVGCTSTQESSKSPLSNYSFVGEWHAVTATVPADMGTYYSIQKDGKWSYGRVNDDATKNEISNGTYIVSGNTAHFTDMVFTGRPFDLTINETGFINEYGGAPGTEAYNDITTYSQIWTGP